MNNNFFNEWLNALRSDEYKDKQVIGQFVQENRSSGELKFCAIGLALHLHPDFELNRNNNENLCFDMKPNIKFNGDTWWDHIFNHTCGTRIIGDTLGLNDGDKRTFSEIADIIENKYKSILSDVSN